jgi:endonuclease/exonuclease/phosphatase family metal-dependent hydrolase
MLFALLYAVLRRVIGSGHPSADRDLEIEVVVLRHQVKVLSARSDERSCAGSTRPSWPRSFIVTGDMNDAPTSQFLAPMVLSPGLRLVDALANPTETRPAPADTPPPATAAWTHRLKPSGQPAEYELFDHIWLSPPLAAKQVGSFIDRRTRRTGDGSDHDPAWVVIDL